MFYHGERVDLTALPPADKSIYYKDFGIVDGPELFRQAVDEIAAEVKLLLGAIA